MGAARPARIIERRMKKSPADECDASRETGKRHSPGAGFSMTQHRRPCQILTASSFRACEARTSDVQLHIGESRDSGFALCAPRNDGLIKKRPACREPLS